MKQYKHKTVNATAELCSDGYWYLIKYFDKDGDETTRFSIPKYLIENTNDWEEIKCKVKPVKLQFGLCKNKMGYYIPQTYFDVNTSILNNPDYHSTHSITIYEEVEE